MVVIRVALAPDRLARLVADQLEGARTHDVFLVPARVPVEDLLLVDPGVGIGERRQKSAGRKFETEHHGQRVRHLDLVDHDVEALTRAGDAFRRIDDLAPARCDIDGCQRRPVVKLHPVANLEGVGPAVIGRLRHLGAEIAHEIGRRGRVLRVDPDQDTVIRRRRMHRRVGCLAMAIEARWRVGRDHVGENAARPWLLLAYCRRNDGEREQNGNASCKICLRLHSFLPSGIIFSCERTGAAGHCRGALLPTPCSSQTSSKREPL